MTQQTDIIRNIIAGKLVKPVDTITAESTFDSLGADSLDKYELIMAIEEAFSLEIPEETSGKWTTVGEVEAYIANHVNEQ